MSIPSVPVNDFQNRLSEISKDKQFSKMTEELTKLISWLKECNLPMVVNNRTNRTRLIRTHVDIACSYHTISEQTREVLLEALPRLLHKYL